MQSKPLTCSTATPEATLNTADPIQRAAAALGAPGAGAGPAALQVPCRHCRQRAALLAAARDARPDGPAGLPPGQHPCREPGMPKRKSRGDRCTSLHALACRDASAGCLILDRTCPRASMVCGLTCSRARAACCRWAKRRSNLDESMAVKPLSFCAAAAV